MDEQGERAEQGVSDPVTADGEVRAGTEPASGVPARGEVRSSRAATWLAVGAVALALAVIWLAPGINEPRTPVMTPSPMAGGEYPGEPSDASAVGKAAPLHFTLEDMNGVDVSLASFKGKVIVLNFWATWCTPCREEIPWLVELQNQYRDRVVVLGISVDDPREKLKPYAEKMGMNYPVLIGNGREDVQEAYGPLYGIPVSVFVGRDGRIAKRHSGIASKDQFERQIKALL